MPNIYDVVVKALEAELLRGTVSPGRVNVSQGQGNNIGLNVQVTAVKPTYENPLVLNCAEGMCHYTGAVIIRTLSTVGRA